MTKENLERGKSISKTLKTLHEQRNAWLKSDRFESIIPLYDSKNANYYDAIIDYVPFDVVKALAISAIDNQIKTLTEEFDSL